jgi:hypothetical protein
LTATTTIKAIARIASSNLNSGELTAAYNLPATTTTGSGVKVDGSAVTDNISGSYQTGNHKLTSNAANSVFIIPVTELDSAYSARSTFTFTLTSPTAIVNIPANIHKIPTYQSVTSGKTTPIQLRVTFTDKGNAALTNASAISKYAAVKFELIDGNGTVIAAMPKLAANIELLLPVSGAKPAYFGAFTRSKVESGTWVFTPHTWGSGQIRISTDEPTEYVAASYTPTFADVPQTQWFFPYVTLAASKKLVNGMNTQGTTYSPESKVTRAEFVQMMANALNLPEQASNTATYSDVRASDWFYSSIMRAKSAGIIGDDMVTNNLFNPNTPILREEMAYILSKVASYCNIPTSSVNLQTKFTDYSTISTKYTSYVSNTVALGLMQGMSATTFEGKGSATRAQAATVLVNMVKKFNYIDQN